MRQCFHSCSLLRSLVFMLCCSFAYGREYLSCPSLAKEQRPALLFISGGIHHSDLKIALFENGSNGVRTKHVLSAKSLQISQLSNAVFLITTHDDARKGKVFAANFDKGKMRHLADSTVIHGLCQDTSNARTCKIDNRTLPSRKTSGMDRVRGDNGQNFSAYLQLVLPAFHRPCARTKQTEIVPFRHLLDFQPVLVNGC